MEKEIKKLELMIKENYNCEDIIKQNKMIDKCIEKIVGEAL